MNFFELKVNEKRFIKQAIHGDTISSATWSITPSGPTIANQIESDDYSMISLTVPSIGTFVLKVVITTTGGQRLIGLATIYVK